MLTLYAAAGKDNPTPVTVFELYTDTGASKAHLQAPDFRKYKSITKDMVKSLELSMWFPWRLKAGRINHTVLK